ncbi:permease [Candidatus Poribacteria bacterium]|nr:permease [Candidatus Poribacteria bacterium]
MNSLVDTLKFFGYIMTELTSLFLGISALIGLIRQFISDEKLRFWLSHKGVKGSFLGALFGAVTPFCACSTIPVTVGLLKAKAPFGSVMSFVLASPILDPLILGLMTAMLGWRISMAYALTTFAAAIIGGLFLEKSGFAGYVKNVRVSGNLDDSFHAVTFAAKIREAFRQAWRDLRAVLIYLVIGVAAGAVIYGYIPQEFIVKLAGPKNPFAIPIAALVGIPLYIRAETAIPIGLALVKKGMSPGAVIALIIGGAGMAIPEMTMLASIFKTRLVAALVCGVFLIAVITGLAVNLI